MSSALDRVNAMEREAFVATLGSLYEHSPWTAERAFERKPFQSEGDLARALTAAVEEATEAERLELIRAHPELAGEKLRARELTDASMSEQAGAGLDRIESDEIAEWAQLNTAYRDRFGFPFVICVRRYSRDEIIEALKRRLNGSAENEAAEAIAQIHMIARLRLADLLMRLEQT